MVGSCSDGGGSLNEWISVLVEIGYLSNADDEAALVSEERQNGMAQAVLDVVSVLTDGAPPAGAR